MRGVTRCLLVLAVAAGCATNPVTGEREIMLVTEADEIAIGRANDEQIVAYYGLYEDPELTAWVDRIGKRMAAASERPDLPWTFRVLDDTAVNAFALPGGFVYLTRGILTHMTSEAEAVGVLGHEIGHVTARHSAQQLSRAQLAQLGLGVGGALSPQVRALGGMLETGVGLMFLKFGRDDESQADELGVRYAVAAGYDPRALADFFRTIDRLSAGEDGRLPTWLSTHPAPRDRTQRVLQMSGPLVAGRADLQVGHQEHLMRIDDVVFGPDPRQGLMVGTTFKHPELRFELDYPAGWAVQNGKRAVTASPEAGDAALGLTLASRGEASLQAYASETVQQREGRVQSSESISIAGLPALRVDYLVDVERVGTLRVLEVFLEYGGNVYDLIGYTRSDDWDRFREAIGRWQGSFRELPAAEAARYRPDRIDVFRAPREGPLADLVRASEAADIETLALLNGLEPADRVDAGSLLKTVIAGYTRR